MVDYGGLDAKSFPRARGDRPSFAWGNTGYGVFPPRTRGSTVAMAWYPCAARVSPAHAGIDRASSTDPRFSSCFPRARGDRPIMAHERVHRDRFPPRTRGSTRGFDLICQLDDVSPAHAGIDLPPYSSLSRQGCFPRARGDRPSRRGIARISRRFPPRTRGSTRARGNQCGAERVSPAHAGIDLVLRRARPDLAGFPRARGDRPAATGEGAAASVFPPRTRGSTLVHEPARKIFTVSPAHAGIDRL